MENVQHSFEKRKRVKKALICQKCGSSNTYFLVKSDGHRCRACGYITKA